jgi:hypothetical protein
MGDPKGHWSTNWSSANELWHASETPERHYPTLFDHLELRNTLLHQINRIQKLTGLDLQSHADRELVYFALLWTDIEARVSTQLDSPPSLKTVP